MIEYSVGSIYRVCVKVKESVFCYGCTTKWNFVSWNKDVLLGVASNCRFYSFVSDIEDI